MIGFYREDLPVARKSHRCFGCRTSINVGKRYLRVTASYDGVPYSYAYHLGCRRWEVKINRLHNPYFDDEWIALHEHVAQGGRDSLAGAPKAVLRRFREQVEAIEKRRTVHA